jgi:MoaA/NifB/PqqE/SkfB family radical SAM enzyme
MPPSHYAKVVKECMELGAVNFSFTGGEPLIYEDLPEYIKSAQPQKNLISISTNGTLLNLQKAKELKRLGVDIITLSIDEFRQNCWQAVDIARQAGLKVTLGVTVSRKTNGDFLERMVKYAIQNRIILMLIYVVPQGRLKGQEDLRLTDENIRGIKNLIKQYAYVRTDFQANYLKERCGGGSEILYITPYGDVQFCAYIAIPFGNVRNLSIKKIRERILNTSVLNCNRNICIAGEGLHKSF